MKKSIGVLILLFCFNIYSFGQIIKTSLNTFQPEQYRKVEFDIKLKAKFDNPYMQEDIKLDMSLISPSGQKIFLPCYYDNGNSGDISVWKARFAPREVGEYRYSFELYKSGRKKSVSKEGCFFVNATNEPGFLRTKSDWVLSFDNGQVFRGVAENICWESRANDDSKYFKDLHELSSRYNYDYLLTNFSKNGGNFFRTWICSWNLPIDYKGNFNNNRYVCSDNYYNPSALARLDHLIELSESLDLYIMLVLGQGGYTLKDRGLVNNSEEFFSELKARAWYKNRLRYIVARWGYSTSIAMWEFFNEVDNVQYSNKQNPIDGKKIVSWHDEMSRYIKQIDPFGHIVTTSISHRDIDGLNSIENIDINQKHIYNKTDIIPSEINKYVEEFGKPYIIGEFGREWDWSKNFDDFSDEMDIDFKRGIWYGLFSPTPILPMSWWWEYFDARGMTPYYRGVREISDRMLESGKGNFEKINVENENLHALGLKCGDELYVYVFNPHNHIEHSDIVISYKSDDVLFYQDFEPTMRVYSDFKNVVNEHDRLILKNEIVGSKCEKLFIVKVQP